MLPRSSPPSSSPESDSGSAVARTLRVMILAGWLFSEVKAWSSSAASSVAPGAPGLLNLSLEELGRVKVTTVSRKSESLSGAAAAVYVITQEDLRRSGAASLPETLRMAPGLDVAQANSQQWAISSRGFNDLFANKLLVLVDGRAIYTPLFSGVFWENADAVLEDLDRIEVIRGPGATLWGANAVNGVINFLSKTARETQGLLLSGGGGLEERAFGVVRYGGALGPKASYRIYGKYSNRDEFSQTDGSGAADDWWMAQQGFRVDWDPSENNRLTLQGDHYDGDWGGLIRRPTLSPPGMYSDLYRARGEGANVLGRWTHSLSAESEVSVQMYYDRTDRGIGIASEIRDTFDLDAQHRISLGDRQAVVWGAGYRYSKDAIGQTADFQALDPSAGLQLVSSFLQDEVTVVPERVRLTVGSKFEHNDFTGFEVQPSARVAWTPTERQTVWGAVSRAVRTPSRAERGFLFYSDPPPSMPPLPLPVVIPASGNPNFGSEDLLAYEIGYRVIPHARLALDLAGFYNEYDHLYNVVQLPVEVRFSPSFQPYLVLPVTDNNRLFGETYGVEATATWSVGKGTRLRANYTFLQMNLHSRDPGPPLTEESEGDSPQHQATLWTDLDLGRNVELGMGGRFVGGLPAQEVSSYTELDARIAWKPTRRCELALVGRNLLAPQHQESSPFLFRSRQVEVDRAVYVKLTLQY